MNFGGGTHSLLCQWWGVRVREVCHGGLLKFGLSIWRDDDGRGKGIGGGKSGTLVGRLIGMSDLV